MLIYLSILLGQFILNTVMSGFRDYCMINSGSVEQLSTALHALRTAEVPTVISFSDKERK